MRKTIAATVALLALVFAPVLWGLPPPGEQAPAELARGLAADSKHNEDDVGQWINHENRLLEAVATERLATTPSTGGVRLLTFKSALVFADAFSPPIPERTQGSTDLPAGGARR